MSADEPTRHATSAIAWAGLTLALTKGASLLSTLILARLLVPADFGLFAVGLLVINYVDRIKDFGVGAALVFRRDSWTQLAGTGLSLSMLSSFVLAALTWAAAPLTADFFRDPRAGRIVQALAFSILVGGLAVVPDSRMRRSLDFRRRVLPEMSASVVKGGVAVVLALAGVGVWSLVWGQLAGTAVQSALYWLLLRWRPRLEWHRETARALLRYGIPSSLVAVLAVATENIDYLVIGREMEPADLGYYTLAYRLPELSVIAVCIVAGQVFFPMFSRLQDDPEGLRRSYLRSIRYVSLITVPGGILLAVLAPEVVYTLYSGTWAPAIPVLRMLALFSVVYSMSFHAGEIYKATGRPGILNWMSVLKVAVFVPALWLAAQQSIATVGLAVLVVNVFLTAVKLAVAQRIVRFSLAGIAQSFLPSIATGVALGGIVLALSWLLTATVPSLGAPPRLLVCLVVALPTYSLLIRLIAPTAFHQVTDLVLRRRAGEPAGPVPGSRP